MEDFKLKLAITALEIAVAELKYIEVFLHAKIPSVEGTKNVLEDTLSILKGHKDD